VGAHGGVLAGVTPNALGVVTAFVDVDRGFPHIGPDLSFRAGFVGAFGSMDTSVGPVSRSILAARVEVCPLRWGSGSWSVHPCVSVDVGATTASSSRETAIHGSRPWVAPGAELRGTFEPLEPLAFEAAAGGIIPLIRSEVGAGSDTLYRDGSVAFEARIGLFVRLR
jgi:hypothetical protein